MYTYNRKKEFIKSGISLFLLLLLAVISTYYIYHKFENVSSIDFNSESLDIVYREKTGDKLLLSKVTPVTDSVGLSSSIYGVSIKNNLTEKVNYKIKIVDDEEMMEEVEEDLQIPKEEIRISVKAGKNSNKIYSLDELEDGILLEDVLDALAEKNISIRIWIRQDTTLPSGAIMYYHGIIQVEEEDSVTILS